MYPFYCHGHCYFISMVSVRDLAVDCIHHCTGMDEPYDSSKHQNRTCLTKFEDAFIGSCLKSTQKTRTRRVRLDMSIMGRFLDSPSQMEPLHMKRDIIVHAVREPHEIRRAHKFYETGQLD